MEKIGFKLIVFLLSVMCINLYGQSIVKDTIYIGKEKVSHLVFHGAKIEHTIFGSNVIVSDDGKPSVSELNNKEILIVKAKKKFSKTNISVITGEIYYDIVCLYSEEQAKSYYFFGKGIDNKEVKKEVSEKENKVITKQIDSLQETKLKLYLSDTIQYFDYAKSIQENRYRQIKRLGNSNGSISVHLIGAYARKDKLYLKFLLKNVATLPYNIGEWEFYYGKRIAWRKETVPENSIPILFEYNQKYQTVLPKSSMIKVFVFDQISIDQERILNCSLSELNGQRNLTLQIPVQYINDAKLIRASYNR